uniref:Prion protein b n=1 Tax=Cyprinus carpio TaxID=7962 RepID=A0A8C1LP48_CYPCA
MCSSIATSLWTKMGQLCKLALLVLVLMAVLHNSSGGKTGGKSTPSKKPSNKPSQGTKTQSNYPRQPSNPAAGSNPGYPNQQHPGRDTSGSYTSAGGTPNQYPGRGGSSPGGYPKQNPGVGSYPAGGSYPSAGGNPNQYPVRGGSSPGGYPNQNPVAGSYPAGGSYPSAGGKPNQYPGRGGSSPGGYRKQNPGVGSYPAGGSYPSAGGNPNQYRARGGSSPGGYPNQNPVAGSYPAGGSYPSAGGNPNQYPGRGGSSPGGYPNQNPGAGTYPAGGSYPSAGGYPNPGRGGVNPGGYPNQIPAGGGYSNQYPGRSGYSPGGYPAGGSYPVRTAGQPVGYPGGHPSIGGGYPNWNPNNRILSPRYGGSFGGGRFGTGGSPFSNTVKSMGYGPSAKSKGFAKKAMLAAGIGAVAGMAVGYGIGNFPRPNFQFRSPQEERQYNHYMYSRQETHSKDRNNKGGPNYTSKQPSQAHEPNPQSYEQYMSTCMKQKDLLKEQNTTDSADRKNIQRAEPLTDIAAVNDTTFPMTVSDYPKAAAVREDDDDTVSIMQIGYPALIEQMKSRKCVELYLVYSGSFTEKQKEHNKDTKGRKIFRPSNNHNGHRVSGVLLLLTTFFMLLSGP